VIKPSFPTKPKPLHLAKLNILMGCLKDRIEVNAQISEYVHKALIGLIDWYNADRGKGLTKLPEFRGFSKTEVGAAVVDSLKKMIRGKKEPAQAAMFFGYLIFKQDSDRVAFLLFGMNEADPSTTILGSAAVTITQMVNAYPSAKWASDAKDQIRAIPFDRRRQALESIAAYRYSPDEVNATLALWSSAEERGSLSIAQKRKKAEIQSN
jgi:hypothetical protein